MAKPVRVSLPLHHSAVALKPRVRLFARRPISRPIKFPNVTFRRFDRDDLRSLPLHVERKKAAARSDFQNALALQINVPKIFRLTTAYVPKAFDCSMTGNIRRVIEKTLVRVRHAPGIGEDKFRHRLKAEHYTQ